MTSGPAIEKPGDLAAILTNSLDEGDVLFIDEIHRLGRVAEEHLYPAMEDYKIDIILGQGPAARTIRLDLPKFTLVGATTRPGLITNPMRDRFGIVEHLEYYSTEELADGVRRDSERLGLKLDEDAALEIGQRSRGTMRIAKRVLRRVRDYAEVAGDETVTLERVQHALNELGIRRRRLRAARPGYPQHHHYQVCRRSGRALDLGDGGGRGQGHARRGLRALLNSAWADQAHPQGARGDPAGV